MRTLFLGLAVMLAAGAAFAGFVLGLALKAGMAASLSRMGADLAAVPRETLVNITASLLTVQPTAATLDAAVARSLAAIPGIEAAAPQRIVTTEIEGHPVNLIAFDPAADFSVMPWLGSRIPGPLTPESLIAGSRAAGRMGDIVTVCGKTLKVDGKLEPTGVGPFDNSYFLSFEALAALAASGSVPPAASASGPAKPGQARQSEGGNGDFCREGMPPGRVSAFLLRLTPSAKIDEVKFSVAQLPGIKIVEGNAALTASRQALKALLMGITVFAGAGLLALMLVLPLLFSAIVQERYREIGLLMAMGARPGQILQVLLAEAAMITGLGGAAGLAFGTALLLLFARSLGYYFDLLGVPFFWPPFAVLLAGAAAVLLSSALLGAAGAFLPAWRVRRTEPYGLIQTPGR